MIRIENLRKAFGERILLKDITYHFPAKQRIALIGANGQGKTTFLKFLLNPQEADSGKVIKPNGLRIGYLPQVPNPFPAPTLLAECMAGHEILSKIHGELEACLKAMGETYQETDHERYESLLATYNAAQGYEWEGMAEKVLLGLGFSAQQLHLSPASLSGGWRMRLELARVLVGQPDFMILDEPTNHLDLPTIEWLEDYLLDYEGTLLFVSHDKAFLNNLSTIVLYLNQGVILSHTGNFDDFMEQREQTAKTTAATVKRLKDQKTHMQRFVDRFGAKASKASQAESRRKMIERLTTMISGLPQEEQRGGLHIPTLTVSPSGKDVLRVHDLVVGYNKEHPLNRSLSLNIQRGEKIAIIGANGIGKSTFLKTIANLIPPLKGSLIPGHKVEIGFFTQDAAETLNKGHTILTTLQEANPRLSEQVIRSLLGAFLFPGKDVLKVVSVLSGGEKTRLALACLLAQQKNFLLLDEPTNHLDIVSTHALAEMMRTYPGTILFVSHDREFLYQAANRVVEIEPASSKKGGSK